MSNTVPSRLAMKLARYCSSSTRFSRQKAERRRNAEVGRRSIIGSPPHRSVLANAPAPRDAVRQDPDAEPDDLPAEPAQDGVRALHRAGEEIDGKGEHGAEPQYSSDAGDGRRQQGERRDPPRQEHGHPGVQFHDRRGARRPERQQSRREADEEPHRGREQHRHDRNRPPAGVERQSHGGPRHGPQQPHHDRRPVLEIDQPGVADQRRVPPDHSSSSTPRANASRITSSIGGSSIDRSASGRAARSRALVAGASSRRTSSTAFGKWKLFTSPNAASASAVTRLPSPSPPPSTNSIRLVRAIRATSASSAPSYSRRPRLIIRTRDAS